MKLMMSITAMTTEMHQIIAATHPTRGTTLRLRHYLECHQTCGNMRIENLIIRDGRSVNYARLFQLLREYQSKEVPLVLYANTWSMLIRRRSFCLRKKVISIQFLVCRQVNEIEFINYWSTLSLPTADALVIFGRRAFHVFSIQSFQVKSLLTN